MATCACGTKLPGRQQKCDACKGANRPTKKAAARPARKAAAKKPAKRAAAKPAKKAGPRKPAAKVTYPDGLGTRGRQLWKALGHDADTPAGVLAVEACRSADRLEHLDQYLTGGNPWLDLVEVIEGSGRYEIVVDRALAEVRQQQVVFRGLLAELGATRVKGHGGYGGETGKPADPTPARPPSSPLDEVTRRRQQREQGA